MAVWQKKHKGSVILHSDRGSQFTSHEYQTFLKDHQIISSMSAVGSCYDNAAAESFFGLLKRERVNRKRYLTRAEARSDVFDYRITSYNVCYTKLLRINFILSHFFAHSLRTFFAYRTWGINHSLADVMRCFCTTIGNLHHNF